MSTSPIDKDEQADISDTESVDEIDNVALFKYHVDTELAQLSIASNRIKKIEAELDKARSDFRCFLSETSAKVKNYSKELGSCVEKAKKCREVGLQVRELFFEAKNINEFQHESMLHVETEKIVNQLQQELKKSINKSCLSTRRSLLQLNNLANQHQLQLLPYFEMKAQFKEMFEEQIKKVPPLEDSDWKMKMEDNDTHFLFEKFSEQFHGIMEDEKSNDFHSKTTNSVTSSYHDSLSSENLYLEHLTDEDLYMELPPSINITPGLVNCTVSCTSNGFFKSPKHQSTEDGSFVNSSSKRNPESFSSGLNDQYIEKKLFSNVNDCLTNGIHGVRNLCLKSSSKSSLEMKSFEHDSEVLKQCSNLPSNDISSAIWEVNDELVGNKSIDSECSLLNLNNFLTDDDEISESCSSTSNEPN